METDLFEELIKEIVIRAKELKDRHTNESSARVNYSAVFSHTQTEYEELLAAANEIGKVVKDTPTGPLFQIKPIDTSSGRLKLLKIRMPDPTRPERGDADFTVSDYSSFKKSCLEKPGFKLIKRKEMEMIELCEESLDVRAYFSHPTLDEQLGI